jgi:hypothetical protein
MIAPPDQAKRISARQENSDGSPDRRRAHRFATEFIVQFEVGEGKERQAWALDIGLGGMLIITEEVPTCGDRVVIAIDGPDISKPLRISAVVRWVTDCGFGVQFEPLGDRETRALVAFTQGGELRESSRIQRATQYLGCCPWSLG